MGFNLVKKQRKIGTYILMAIIMCICSKLILQRIMGFSKRLTNIIYQCSKSKRFGTAEVYVDGELCSEVKGSSSTGWNNPVAQLVFKSGELKTRRIEIKMDEGNEDTYFGILGFGYTD